jgi:light-regulated signal transduction histidine kinase (bacteriophytochrome)
LQEKNEEIEAQNEELQQSKEATETQNEELRQSKEEIISQRDVLTKQNDKLLEAQDTIARKNREIKLRNDYLEKIVDERTYELKSTVQDLLKHNQDLEQFSYIISHNLRSPVARIQGLINIFNQENMNDDFNKQILSHLHQSSYDLDMVIRDLTEIVSIRKSLNTSKEPVNIEELISNELIGFGGEIKQADAIIEKDLAIKSIYSIKAYIQSIFHNLISNAIKYRHNSRQLHILIKTSRENNNLCLIVQDNGLGVDTTDLYKIFGLYQRMHTHVEGKGSGLYFVKTQIEAMNGKIELESSINQGSIFKVYLPL